MDKAEIEAIRARCKKATSGPWYSEGWGVWDDDAGEYADLDETADAEFIAHARQDIPALLDELDTAEQQVLISEDMINTNVRAASQMCADMKADRDRWKARAEALFRAISGSSAKCELCIHGLNEDDNCGRACPISSEDEIYPSWRCCGFDFDEAQFALEGENG